MKQKIISFGGTRHKASPREKNNARRRRRRTGRQTLNYLLLIIVVTAIMTALSLTVFFNIEAIRVTGVTKYAPEDIIETSAIEIGDNLFRIDEKGALERLKSAYPYVENVSFKRELPSVLCLEVEQAKPLGAVDSGGGYIIIGQDGRILETGAQSISEDVLVVNGMYIGKPEVGHIMGAGFSKDEQEIEEKESASFKRLNYLIDALEQTQFSDFTMIDFSDDLNMRIVYQNRVIIEIGSVADLVYKLTFADYLLRREISTDFEGTLDVSISPSTKNAYTRPGDIQSQLARRGSSDEAQTGQEHSSAQIPGFDEFIASNTPSLASDSSASSQDAANDILATIPGTERVKPSESQPDAAASAAPGAAAAPQSPSSPQSSAASTPQSSSEPEPTPEPTVNPFETIPGTERTPPSGASDSAGTPPESTPPASTATGGG